MHRTIVAFSILGLVAALAGLNCGDSSGEHVAIAQSDKQRVTSPLVAAADQQAQVTANTALAVDLYHQLSSGSENLFFSPHSISAALVMAYGGARGLTESEMATALHLVLPQAKLHPVFNKLDLELASRGQGAAGSDGKAFELSVANSLWGRPDGTYLAPYLDLMALNYGAGIRLVDFGGDTEGARSTINQWVAQRTRERIKELLHKGDIDTATALVLVNAIYFNAAWQEPFEETMTAPHPFDAAGGQVSVQMMAGLQEKASYAKAQGYEAVELPFDGGELSMVVLLPDAGTFEAWRQGLSATSVTDALAALAPQQVYLKLPRFSFSSRRKLRSALEALGMKQAFDEGAANFEGICGAAGGKAGLVIKDVIHEAFVQVAEKGAEAAAATAVTFADAGAAMPTDEPVYVTVDRSFLFLIRDIKTGVVLFMGQVVDPNA